MKKALSIILVLILLFSFASCDKKNEGSDSTTESTSAQTEATESTTEAEANEETTAAPESEEETTAEDTTAKETTEAPETEDSTEAATAAPETAAPQCTHSQIKKINAKEATCASTGYSGDEICELCGITTKAGDMIPKSSTHGETFVKDAKEATSEAEGYTGDTVCKLCNAVIAKGEAIPKKAEEIEYVICQDPFGNQITIPKGTDVLDYTLSNANLPATASKYAKVEAEILRLTNVERQKAGLAPLENEPGAYFFSSKRAEEASVSWSHTRPNGQQFYHIFAEYGVFYMNCGENLYAVSNITSQQLQNDAEWINTCATGAVEGWMNSADHRENLLNPDFTSISIGVYVDEATNEVYAVQLFFA